MRYFSTTILLLLYCLPALAQEPRGKEFLPTVQAEDVESPALFAEVVTPITVRPEETPLQPDEKRVIVHARPVWQVSDSGALAPISTAVDSGIETLKQVWKADGNTVRFRVNEDGLCVYKAGQHVLRARPIKSQAEATDGSTLADADQVKPTETTAQTDRVVQIGSFSSVRFEHVVEPGAIKEIAWLDSPPTGIATARWYVLAYRWDSDALTPTIVNGDVIWKTKAGKAIFRWPAPVVTDATGKELRANYRIRAANPNVIAVLVNATDLRAATYPVALDPTTTTGSGASTAGRSRVSTIISGADRRYQDHFFLITLPDMTGNTITAAQLQVYGGGSSSVATNVYAFKTATSWNGSSNLTTMNSVAGDRGTALVSSYTSWSSSTWHYFDILGDSGKGVVKIYNANINPGACTFSLAWTTSVTLNTTLAGPRIGDQDAGTTVEFAAYNDVTNYPRVAITYTSGGGGNTGSFLFGSN